MRASPLYVPILLLVLALLWPAAPSHAHKTNVTTSRISVSGPLVRYRLRVSAHDAAVAVEIPTDLKSPIPRERFETAVGELEDYFTGRMMVTGDGEACPPSMLLNHDGLPEWLEIDLTFTCSGPPSKLRVDFLVFFHDIDPTHRSLGRLTLADGTRREFLFDRETTRLDVDLAGMTSEQGAGERLVRLIVLGAEHIAGGFDHVLFLLMLLVAAPAFGRLALIVTTFTAAHSVTLGLAWFGVIEPPVRLVETLIALSIAWVAIENLLGLGTGRRWVVVGAFGLVHGLGFYSAMSALDLDRGSAALTLFGFNLGVEVGQLLVVGLGFALLLTVRARPWYGMAVRAVSLATLFAAGWWIAERAIL